MKKSVLKEPESTTHFDSPHSPFRIRSSPLSDGGDPNESESPPQRFHSPENSPESQHRDNSRAIVVVGSPAHQSPLHDSDRQSPTPENAPPVVVINRAVRQEPQPAPTNLSASHGGRGREGGGRGRSRTAPAMNREKIMRTAALGFRVSEVVLCLISFSIMAADKTQGWSGDSFYRYKEYRYCLSMNVIAFVYAAFQACDLATEFSGKQLLVHHFRPHFDFFMDQVLAYLLMSASSSAATRVDDWQSNWGRDEFTEMASASVAFSFLAFIAFSISSLISSYNLFTLYPVP
ncbi:CASP-like protein 4A3 [Arachis stenosperma]|uniref:CASP-like protein 4A3 n=1 Tax=Arachis stenosperma TaxID=217475 RepID=UPI0025ACE841|nr:CASP-like protein 4A3 [Arachis stenosperma]